MASNTVNQRIEISIAKQTLNLFEGDDLVKQYMVASAKNGIGQIEGSECTPLGKHKIAEKIGENAPENAVFVGREWTQEIYTPELASNNEGRDWILSRILWLEGLEEGFNCGYFAQLDSNDAVSYDAISCDTVSCDTKTRYIYIHGCPDSHAMQIPSSHGCIKMRNADMIELFERVDVATLVTITSE